MEYSLIICTWHLMYFFHYFISLRTTDAICWHRHWSTLAQVMACCLTAQSHNLNHCWLKTRFISTCITRNILGKLHIKRYFFLVFFGHLPGTNELIMNKTAIATGNAHYCQYWHLQLPLKIVEFIQFYNFIFITYLEIFFPVYSWAESAVF